MIRWIFFGLSLFGVFAFSSSYNAVLIFIAALFMPILGVSFGIVYDVLYFTHGTGFPVATIAGILGSITALFAHRFIRARISDFSF